MVKKMPKSDEQLRGEHAEMLKMLELLAKEKFPFPNIDFYECCAGCGLSPYHKPPHKPDCIVTRVHALLRKVR